MSKTAVVPLTNGAAGSAFSSPAKSAFETLVKSAKVLASDRFLGQILEHFDDIPKLEAQLKSKDEQITKLGFDMRQMTDKYQTTHQESLSIYETSKDKLKSQLEDAEKRISLLESEVERKNAAFEARKSEQAGLTATIKELKQTIFSQGTKIKKAETMNNELKKTMETHEAASQELKKELHSQGDQLQQTGSELKRKHDELTNLNKEHGSVSRQLEELHSCFVTQHDKELEPILQKLQKNWAAVSELVWAAFSVDLPDSIYQNETAWNRLKDTRRYDHSLPLPQSNSVAAKQMRSVVVIAIVAHAIDFYIFQPTYFLPPSIELRRLMSRQAQDAIQKEAVFRALLQAMLPVEQDTSATRQVVQMCDEVMHDIMGLLPFEKINAFKDELTSIVEDVRDIWREVQCSRSAVEPRFRLEHYSDWHWGQLHFDGQHIKVMEDAKGTMSAKEAQLAVFPRFYLVDQDGLDPITHGVVITKSQTEAAAQEVEDQSSSSSLGRSGSLLTRLQRPRRASTTNKSHGDQPAPQAFLEQQSSVKSLEGKKPGR